MLSVNPPQHTRLRRLVSKAFTARKVEQLRAPEAELVDTLLDQIAGHHGRAAVAAGFETTTHLLGNGLVALPASPDQANALREDPDLAPTAVEELLRFDSSVQLTGRTALAHTEVAGVPIARGARLVCYTGAANRDPQRFDDPNRLDLARRDGAPLCFGGGIRYCLGAPLARLEAQLAFPALLTRYPNLQTSDGAQRRDSLTLRGNLHLPVNC